MLSSDDYDFDVVIMDYQIIGGLTYDVSYPVIVEGRIGVQVEIAADI